MAGKSDIVKGALDFTAKLLSGEGDEAAKAGIRAYHGSPHSFDKFSMSKLGTGEGAQAYGHGLYFAENEGVAKSYRDDLSSGTVLNVRPQTSAEEEVLSRIKNYSDEYGGVPEEATVYKDILNDYERAGEWIPAYKDMLNRAGGGSMYEVNIDANPNAFLDWDKPLSNQPEAVRKFFPSVEEAKLLDAQMDKLSGDVLASPDDKALQAAWDAAYKNPKYRMARIVLNEANPKLGGKFASGNQVYAAVAQHPSEASTLLKEAGIPGIKFLDAGSRGKGIAQVQVMYKGQPHGDPIPVQAWNQVDQLTNDYRAKGYDVEVQDLGTRNYVVFDDKLISIVRKYGIAGASAMLGYNLMEQLDPKQALAATMADEEYRVGKAVGGSVREGYAGKGRVVGDVVEQALKLVMGDGDDALRRYMQRSFVKDNEGNPIRLYHATPKSFDAFNVDPEGNSGPAIFLSPYANQQPAAHNVGGGEGVFREGTNVMPVYARVNSPLVIDTPDMLDWARSVYGSEFPHFVNKDARESLIKDGYDGVVFGGYKPKEYAEGIDVGQQPYGDEEVVVLHPNQVKSAISNEGTYDPNDPRINKDVGGEVDPYADEVARAKALMAEKQYDDQSWGDWAGDAVGNALNTAKAILPTALGGEGSVGISDIARGAYEGAKDAVTFPGDVISGKQPLYDESGRPLESAVGRSFNTVGAVGGASSLVPVPDNSLRVFGGIKSKTADKNALTKAQIMESQGASPEDIHGSTGWYRGTDEQWRYEIPDIGSTVDPGMLQLDLYSPTIASSQRGRLGDYLNHPEFFAAYPEMKNMEVRLGPPDHFGSSYYGYYMPRYDNAAFVTEPYIKLSSDYLKTPEQQRNTLLHEIQHAVQQKEGFMKGANPNSIAPDTVPDPRIKIYEDAVANDPDFQEWRGLEKSYDFQKQIREANKFYKQEYDPLFKELNARDDAGEDTYGEWSKLSDEYEKKVHEMFPLMKRRAELGQSLTRRGIPLTKPMKQFLTPQEAYERTAGEVEARNVQFRKDMPTEELKYKFPDTTEDIQKREQLIDWNDTSWRKGYAGRGRVAKGIADEVVGLAKRILGSEPEVRKVTGAELLKKTEGLSEDPFGYSKFAKPLSEMEYTVKMLPREEYKSLDPYDLVKQNATIAGHISDRTAAGREITNIGGTDLTSPLRQRGGADYQRTTLNAWANRQGAAKGLNRKLNEAAGYKWDKGKKEFVPQAGNPDVGNPVYTTPVFMGASSANSSHMVGVPLIRMIPNLPISKGDKLAFDAMMSERFPGWPGIENTAEAEQFMYSGKIPGSAITRFVKYASGKKWKGAGFPDTSEIMFSAMDPRLVGVPQGSTGMGFKEFNPGRTPIVRSNDYHPDYPSAIPGKEYAGGFKYQVPNSIMLPDWWHSLKPELRLPENATKAQHTLMTQVPTQKATPEWADRILEHWEKNPKPWGYAEGGSVEGEDSWFDSAMTVARNAADKATFGTAKYAAAGADYLTDAALDAAGYENDADFDRALAEQEYAMKEGEEKYPAAAGAGDVLGYVAPYLAIGPAEGALSTLGYLSDYGNKVGKTGSLFARALGYADGGEVDDDIYHAVRLARDVGGATNENPQVMMTDANGVQYDATGKVIQTATPQANSNSSAAPSPTTPQEVGRRAAEDPATFDAMMERYAVPDRDIVDYEALKKEVSQQPQQVQQMTHVGAPPMRDIKVDMPLFGGEYNVGQAPYDIANPMSGVAQTAYDFKTVPLYFTPMTAPIGAGMDVAEGVATGDPLTASLAIGFGPGGKMAKAAGIGAANYFIDPSEAEAGPARWFSKAMEVASALPMEKMTGQQALAMLRKGTSPEELRWTGAENFLSSRPQVSKSELVDYLNNNRVKLNQVTLGGSGRPTRLQDVSQSQIPEEILSKYRKGVNDAMELKVKYITEANSLLAPDKTIPYDNYAQYKSLMGKATQAGEVVDQLGAQMRQEYVDSIGGLGVASKFGPDSSHGENLTTPGGKGYQENLYQIPQRDIFTPFVDQMRKDVWAENYKEAIANGFSEDRAKAFADKFNNLKPGELAKFLGKEEELASVFESQRSLKEGSYTGGHWGEYPDVIAHTRTNELLYEPPGANRPYRVHNVEETQSDPGQAGRKRGFKDPQAMAAVVRLRQETQDLKAKLKSEQARLYSEHQERISPYVEERVRYERELRDKYKRGEISLGDMNRAAEEYAGPEPELTGQYRAATYETLNPIMDKIAANEAEIQRIGSKIGSIPMMPYVTSTEAWTDLAIKKELDKALDSGSDYFSWTPGEAHVERYDLSRHIGKIEYNPDDGSFLAYDPSGRMVVNESINDPSDLDEYVGKELGDKIRAEEESRRFSLNDSVNIDKNEDGDWGLFMNGEQMYTYSGEPLTFGLKSEAKDYLRQMQADEFSNNPVRLEGLDIKTGGEGMTGYYDKIYLKRVQEVLKKATGAKPEIEVIEVQTSVGPRKQLGIKLTDEMREKARFSDFNRGGTVTAPSSYGNDDPAVSRAIALTREY